jgi:hypothetical protein
VIHDRQGFPSAHRQFDSVRFTQFVVIRRVGAMDGAHGRRIAAIRVLTLEPESAQTGASAGGCASRRPAPGMGRTMQMGAGQSADRDTNADDAELLEEKLTEA